MLHARRSLSIHCWIYIVLTNACCVVSQSGVCHCHFSAHRFVRFDLPVPRRRHKPTLAQSRSLRNVDIPSLHFDLAAAGWQPVLASRTVSDQCRRSRAKSDYRGVNHVSPEGCREWERAPSTCLPSTSVHWTVSFWTCPVPRPVESMAYVSVLLPV